MQDECANRLYRVCTHSSNADDGEWWVFLQFIKLSPVDVMILSLGAWWPEDRSSSSVSQFLPSRSWGACQMAVRWKDGYRGDLSPWLFLQLCFCSVWGRCPAERGGQTQRCAQLSARLSAELCSPDLWRYCTTLRCTESIHFLWPLNSSGFSSSDAIEEPFSQRTIIYDVITHAMTSQLHLATNRPSLSYLFIIWRTFFHHK